MFKKIYTYDSELKRYQQLIADLAVDLLNSSKLIRNLLFERRFKYPHRPLSQDIFRCLHNVTSKCVDVRVDSWPFPCRKIHANQRIIRRSLLNGFLLWQDYWVLGRFSSLSSR